MNLMSGTVAVLSWAVATAPVIAGEGAAYRPLGVNARGMALFERPADGARIVWIPAGAFRQNGYFPRATDAPEFEGFNRVAANMKYIWEKQPWDGRQQSLRLYLPSRSAQVLAPA